MAKKLTNNLHGGIDRAILKFEVPGGTVVGLHNALAFALNNADQFVAEGNSCEHCINAIRVFKSYMAKVLDYSGAAEVDRPKPN